MPLDQFAGGQEVEKEGQKAIQRTQAKPGGETDAVQDPPPKQRLEREGEKCS